MLILSGVLAILQAPFVDSVLLNPFSLLQDCFPTSEIYVGRRQVLKALMVSAMIVVADKLANLPL